MNFHFDTAGCPEDLS